MRIRSVVDDDTSGEMARSIAADGIHEPLIAEEVAGELWLVDGQHRIEVALALDLPEVPCYVHAGTAESVLVKNLVTTRQHGRSNPAQEALVIRHLREAGGLPLERIAEITGLSVGWCRRLNDIAALPPGVMDLVASGQLGVSHAMELVAIATDPAIEEIARQAAAYHYTVLDVRARVQVALQPAAAPQPGGTTFDGSGRPSRVPLLCHLCRVDLGTTPPYVWMCGDCQVLVVEMHSAYVQALAAADASPAPRPPLTTSPTP